MSVSQENTSAKTYKNDISRLRIFIGPVCESLKPLPPGTKRRTETSKPVSNKYAHAHVKAQLLEDITPTVIHRFLAKRSDQDAWAPKSMNLMRQILHKLFSYAIKHQGFRSRDSRHPNPVSEVERFSEPAPQIRFLNLEEIDEQLELLKSHPEIRMLVAMYIYAGLRREEALWLTCEDVDLDKRFIRVRAKTIEERFWQPKTKRNRVVPISNKLCEVLNGFRPNSYSEGSLGNMGKFSC